MTMNLTKTLPRLLNKAIHITPVIAGLALSGCYVEVTPTHGGTYTSGGGSQTITNFTTQLLVDSAITPFVVAAESAGMVINPDGYITPTTRSLSRATVIKTTYADLFENRDCAYGGYTHISANADTTTYADGFIYVDLDLNSQANNCRVLQHGVTHTINSHLTYDVTGYYDDVANRLSSIDASLSGELEITYRGRTFEHRSLNLHIGNQSANDLSIAGNSRLSVDDGYYRDSVQMATSNDTHIYVGDTHPHYGTVRLSDGQAWVSLSFESNGVWRNDSNGYSYYASWSELGY